jgi:hypothetical protein
MAKHVASRGFVLIGIASALLGLSLVGDVSAEPSPPPIPDQFCGTWGNHGSQIQIDCDKVVQPDSPFTPLATNMTMEGRTYVWCTEPGTNKRNPPPCDRIEGNNIINGYQAWLDAEPSSDPSVDGLTATFVTGTNQEQLGTSLTLTVEDGPLLVIEPGDARYCRVDTDPTIRQMWCGA